MGVSVTLKHIKELGGGRYGQLWKPCPVFPKQNLSRSPARSAKADDRQKQTGENRGWRKFDLRAVPGKP